METAQQNFCCADFLTHREENAHKSRKTDEDNGMEFFCFAYLIGQDPQYHCQGNALPVDGRGGNVKKVGNGNADTGSGDQAGGSGP